MIFTNITLDEVSISDHPRLIEMAEDGNILAAKTLMADAAVFIQYGKALPEPLAGYIGKALYQSAVMSTDEGDSPDKAFNLARKHGSNKGKERLKAYRICVAVELAYRTVGTFDKAFELVSIRYEYKDVRSVKDLFLKWRGEWDLPSQTDGELKDFEDKINTLLNMDAT